MTTATKYAPRRLATPALALAAMLLAGCSSGNIGESWLSIGIQSGPPIGVQN